jgi:hypothetical protein
MTCKEERKRKRSEKREVHIANVTLIQSLFPANRLTITAKQGLERFFETLNFGMDSDDKNEYNKRGIYTTGNCFETEARGISRKGNERPTMDQNMRKLLDLIASDLFLDKILISITLITLQKTLQQSDMAKVDSRTSIDIQSSKR